MKAKELVKKYNASSKMLVPRAVFMFLLFATILIFASFLFMGVGVSFSSVFAANASAAFFSGIVFVVVQLVFLFCIFILQYGLFLSNLRFVRNQPVALAFLFAGFKQRRAKNFAAFFIVPIVVAFAIIIFPVSVSMAMEIPQTTDPQTIVEYFNAKPDLMQMFALRTILFFFVCLVLYFPFAFTWGIVYDGIKKSFKTLFAESLYFWKGKFLNFIGFEIATHYKRFFAFLLCDIAEYIAQKNSFGNIAGQIIASVFNFLSLVVLVTLIASVILSINFYYNEHIESNENSQPENSN